MAWKTIIAATTALAVGFSGQPAAPAHHRAAAAAPAPANPIRTWYHETITGQPLRPSPPQPFDLLVTQATYQPGERITCHKHPWPRYVLLQTGHLRVITYNPYRVHNFTAPRIVVEATDQWHEGLVMGDQPVTLIAFEQVPPRQQNSIPWPPPPPATSPCQNAPPAR